ncbi:hypothetical protein QF045_004977 [Pseudomonas sp. W4I3]|nr:hypothetical protein [Pseudomonas sp. W4I3]
MFDRDWDAGTPEYQKVVLCRSELAREKRPGNASILDRRRGPEFFASKLAPTQKALTDWYLTWGWVSIRS